MTVPLRRFWQLALLILFAVVVSVVLLDFTYRDLQNHFVRRSVLRQAETLRTFIKSTPDDSLRLSGRPLVNALRKEFQRQGASAPFQNVYWFDRTTGQIFPLPANDIAFPSLALLQQTDSTGLRLIRSQPDAPWIVQVAFSPRGDLLLTRKAPAIGWFNSDFWLYFGPLIVFIALIFTLIFLVIYYSFKRPLRSVRNLADHLQAGDYQYRISYARKDEFTDIFSRINRSLERLGAGTQTYRQEETHVRTLLKALDESIVVLGRDFKLNTFNAAAVRLLHCASEADFAPCFTRILEENMALRDLLRQFKSLDQDTLSRELVLWVKDDVELNVNLTLQRLDKDRFLLTFKDLSRIKELQNNLLRSMKFGIIANLVSSISHEIRNPLSAVGIHAEILSTRLHKEYPELDPKLKKSLHIIQNEIKRINRIHTQFFNLARKRELKLTALKPNALIDDVVQLVQHHALEQQIDLHTQLDTNIDFIYGDADQLKQVILNVVLNAFQAVGENGRVAIRTRQDQQKVYLEISDNGPGIAPEAGEHIFDLYFTTKPDGGGIGLALCKKIVEAHEGRIWFRSSPGEGATFFIALPRIDQTHKQRIQTRLTKLSKR